MKIEQRIRFWYLKFERISNDNDIIHRQVTDLSNQADKLKAELEIMKKREEKNTFDIVQVIKELRSLQQESEKMEFSNIELEK